MRRLRGGGHALRQGVHLVVGNLFLQFQRDALRCLFANARRAAQGRCIAHQDGQRQIPQRHAAQYRDGCARADAAHPGQAQKHLALLARFKAKEIQPILPHIQIGIYAHAFAHGPGVLHRVHTANQLIADTTGLDHQLVVALFRHDACHVCKHADAPYFMRNCSRSIPVLAWVMATATASAASSGLMIFS